MQLDSTVILKVTIVKEHFRTRNMNIVHKSAVMLQYCLDCNSLNYYHSDDFNVSYSSIILKIVTWINYLMSIVFLGILAKKFISWYVHEKECDFDCVCNGYAISLYL